LLWSKNVLVTFLVWMLGKFQTIWNKNLLKHELKP
jgi:hypothetical protein